MTTPTTILNIAKAVIKGHSEKYDRFLDNRSSEWAEQVSQAFREKPVGSDDESATKRLSLYKQIVAVNETYCRRDIIIPDLEYSQQLERIDKLLKLRKKAGKLEPYAPLLSQTAAVMMLNGEYQKAEQFLREAISANNSIGDLMSTRGCVHYIGDLARCLYMQNRFDEAKVTADETRQIASRICPEEERREWERKVSAPGLEFVPIAVQAFFSCCDVRVHHEKWDTDNHIRMEFNGLWSDSVSRYDVPKIWRTPLKIAVASDRAWVVRAESYVEDIMKTLYVDSSTNMTAKIYRMVQVQWAGFDVDFSNISGKAASVVASAILAILLAGANSDAEASGFLRDSGSQVRYDVNGYLTNEGIQNVIDLVGYSMQETDIKSVEEIVHNVLDNEGNDRYWVEPGKFLEIVPEADFRQALVRIGNGGDFVSQLGTELGVRNTFLSEIGDLLEEVNVGYAKFFVGSGSDDSVDKL